MFPGQAEDKKNLKINNYQDPTTAVPKMDSLYFCASSALVETHFSLRREGGSSAPLDKRQFWAFALAHQYDS